ncbi:MAG: hypothetical protein AB7G75_25735 [Candidatus Binatia bacterium]
MKTLHHELFLPFSPLLTLMVLAAVFLLFSRIGLPIPSVGLAIGFLGASLFLRWSFLPPTNVDITELRELYSALGFLLLTRESWMATQSQALLRR